jgi:hypothetical protein
MVKKLMGRVIVVPKGDLVNKDIVLVADNKYFSSLTVGGKIVGNVSVFQEQALFGGLCPTNVHVIVPSGGSLTGNISGVDEVEISGDYSGNIDAGSIKIHKGATAKGSLHCVFFYKKEDTEVEAQVTAQVCREL